MDEEHKEAGCFESARQSAFVLSIRQRVWALPMHESSRKRRRESEVALFNRIPLTNTFARNVADRLLLIRKVRSNFGSLTSLIDGTSQLDGRSLSNSTVNFSKSQPKLAICGFQLNGRLRF